MKPYKKYNIGDAVNGMKFISYAGRGNYNRMLCNMECFCGKTFTTYLSSVVIGNTKSCGCVTRQKAGLRFFKHGLAKTSEHNTWVSMRRRCYDTKCKAYKNYGLRGIKVCDRWMESFENFFTDMGKRPTPEHSLERINNDDSYCPKNCKWETTYNQCRNRRNNTKFTYNGRTLVLSDWAKEYGINRLTLRQRLVTLKWPIEMALSNKDYRFSNV
jgi:hypothetical protein